MQGVFDIDKLRQEAHTRWLKPSEVYFILQNHERYEITQVHPDRPPSGSLFLYNKRVMRYFRKDGHSWRKKRDGRTVGEAHERLKVGNVDALNCYYAHGEQDPYFQRRSYWMLDPAFEHIVLVHYREVSEGRYTNEQYLSPDGCSTLNESINNSNTQNQGVILQSSDHNELYQSPCSLNSVEVSSKPFRNNWMDSPNSDDRSGNSTGSSQTNIISEVRKLKAQLSLDDDEEKYSVNAEILLPHSGPGSQDQGTLFHGIDEPGYCIPHLSSNSPGYVNGENVINWAGMALAGNINYHSEPWFDQDQFTTPLEADIPVTVAAKQLFTIREVSPEWTLSSRDTKVIITGEFLCDPLKHTWAVMFGNIEVPLKIIQNGVLRCQAPPHMPGKVTLCITTENRVACSEIRDFEYLAHYEITSQNNLPKMYVTKKTEELQLLVRFAKLLCGFNCGSVQNNYAGTEIDPLRKSEDQEDQWDQVIKALSVGNKNPSDTIEWVLQELLKDKLQHWLSSKHQEDEITGFLLSKQEQGMIHMISGLGYEWALNPLINSGIGINFRDGNGWTALHWAALFGREKMVAALLAAGASAGAVTDPTAHDPIGKTPASIAASHGHKGLAGYLSEVALTAHLSSLTIKETEISRASAEVEAENALKNISESTVPVNVDATTEDQLSLKDSLAAARNAAQAAARIQAAFRALSFRKQQQKAAAARDEYGFIPEEIRGLSAALRYQKGSHGTCDDNLHQAALSIQKKFRGWKGRKNFLTLRKHAVTIQAHVRGHQVRKKYKELLWCVNVIEKVILRWRRRGVGLRGFHVESDQMDEVDEDDILKIFRKQKVDAVLEEAVKQVLSMVGSSEARQQYRRVLDKFRQAKAKQSNATETSSSSDIADNHEDDLYQLLSLDDGLISTLLPYLPEGDRNADKSTNSAELTVSHDGDKLMEEIWDNLEKQGAL